MIVYGIIIYQNKQIVNYESYRGRQFPYGTIIHIFADVISAPVSLFSLLVFTREQEQKVKISKKITMLKILMSIFPKSN